ncbi:hypothetical protein BH09PSE6_BH09PSE6_13900 [soil metagenome]
MSDAGLQLPPSVCSLLLEQLPLADPGDAAMALIDRARELLLGTGLMTLNANLMPDAGESQSVELQRVWTSNATSYPVAGRKLKPATPWSRTVLREGRVFVGEGDAAIASAFDDHAVIAALGLHAIVNTPILENGRCVATVNILGAQAAWTFAERMAIRLLALLAAPSAREAARRARVD